MAFVARDEAGYPFELPTWTQYSKHDYASGKYAIQATGSSQSLDKELLAALDLEESYMYLLAWLIPNSA